MDNSRFIGSFVIDEVINYWLREETRQGGKVVKRDLGLLARLEDSAPTYPIGRPAKVFFSNYPQMNMPHCVVAFEEAKDVDVFVTVSDTFMEKLELLLTTKGLAGTVLNVSGPLAPQEHPDHQADGVYNIEHFDFCWNGPASSRAR